MTVDAGQRRRALDALTLAIWRQRDALKGWQRVVAASRTGGVPSGALRRAKRYLRVRAKESRRAMAEVQEVFSQVLNCQVTPERNQSGN